MLFNNLDFIKIFNESHFKEMDIGNVEKFYLKINGIPLESSADNKRKKHDKPKGQYGARLNLVSFDSENDAETKKAEILKEHPDFNVEIFSQESETYQQLLQKAKASSQY